jgi:hypothetical protein
VEGVLDRYAVFLPVGSVYKYLTTVGLTVATLAIFVRSIFRVAELREGFNGPLANDEVTFMILEGAMMVIATLCLTVLHPGYCFGGYWDQTSWKSIKQSSQLSLTELKPRSSRA